MTASVIDRFVALDSAFREHARRGERMYARFAALSGLSSDVPPELLVSRAIAIRDELNAGLGAWKEPGKSMRLVFAAALAAAGRTAPHFFDTRGALNRRRKERGGRGLNHGGSCAALALVSAGGLPHHVDAFYDILEAIAAPWWRRDSAREEMVAAIFAAMGEMPHEALERLDTARQALRTAGVAARQPATNSGGAPDPLPQKCLSQVWSDKNSMYYAEGEEEPEPSEKKEARLRIFNEALAEVRDSQDVGNCVVYASWSPGADWDGLHFASSGLCLVNLAPSRQTKAERATTILHEISHSKTTAHDVVFVNELQRRVGLLLERHI